MKTNYLISYKWKKVGWIIFIPSCLLGLLTIFLDEQIVIKVPMFMFYQDLFKSNFCQIKETDIFGTIVIILLIISTLLIAFSKEKIEDEFIAHTRLNSLAWALIINYLVLFVLTLLMWNMAFATVMIFNMFTPILIFIFRFKYLLYNLNKSKEQN